MITLGSCLVACIICLSIGCLIGVVAMACCAVAGRESRREEARSPIAPLSFGDQIWWQGR